MNNPYEIANIKTSEFAKSISDCTATLDDDQRYRILLGLAKVQPDLAERWLALAMCGGDPNAFLDRVVHAAMGYGAPIKVDTP